MLIPIYSGDLCKIRLPAVRANTGMSQAEWAEALGVNIRTVIDWENGKREPTYEIVRIMSRLSGIPVDFIFIPKRTL